jgi:hypothetical protein
MKALPLDPALLAGQGAETGRDPALLAGHKPSSKPTINKEPEPTTDTRAGEEAERSAPDVCAYRPHLGHLEVGGYCAACSERLVPWDVNA